MLTQNLSVFLGTDRTWKFKAWDQSALDGTTEAELDEALQAAIEAATAVPLDVAGFAFEFVVRTSDKTQDAAVLSKTTGSGITVTGSYNVLPASNTQRIEVAVTDADIQQWDGSTGIRAKVYRYALKRTDDGSEQVYAKGNIEFLPSPAR